MSQPSIQLLLAVFQDENAANKGLEDLKRAQKSHLIAFQDAAVVCRDQDKKLHIKELADPGGGRGALVGGVMGAIIGLLGGPGGAIVAGAAGALVGGVTARVIDSGIPDDRLEQIGRSLTPGTSAIVAIVEHTWLDKVERQLVKAGAQVQTEPLRTNIPDQLSAAQPPDNPPGETG